MGRHVLLQVCHLIITDGNHRGSPKLVFHPLGIVINQLNLLDPLLNRLEQGKQVGLLFPVGKADQTAVSSRVLLNQRCHFVSSLVTIDQQFPGQRLLRG